MNLIKCMIVDDEPPARELIQRYCQLTQQLEVTAMCTSAIQAFDLLRNVEIDLIFLDIQMPVLNGVDFIKTLKHPPSIILTTAYREYALDGYDLDIIDYLLKPISFDRFLKSIDRYQSRAGILNGKIAKETKEIEHLVVNVNKKKHKVILSDILYIESLKDYYRIHFDDKRLVVKGNIGSVSKELPPGQFLRIHRSFIARRGAITSYSANTVSLGPVDLPIGTSYRKSVAKELL